MNTQTARPSLIKAFVASKYATATALPQVASGWRELSAVAKVTVETAAPLRSPDPMSWSWASVARTFGHNGELTKRA